MRLLRAPAGGAWDVTAFVGVVGSVAEPVAASGARRARAGDVLRAVRRMLPDAEIIRHPATDADVYGGAYSEPPTLREAAIVEGSTMRAVRVRGEPSPAFGAFLDGLQRVRILSHWRGVPLVSGTVAGVVRVRQHRRLVTWRYHPPMVRHALYVPLRYLPALDLDAARRDGVEVVDTAAADEHGRWPSRHPAALRACAIERVRADREAVERELAEAWCAREHAPIFIDGGITGSGRVAAAECAVGVVKSHQTLYADGTALDVVLSLRRGERSTVFRITPRTRASVVSWYLRVRDPAGEDATFGLVRVEAAETPDVARRADEISCWILAEVAPLSLPDSRWDKMMYGIRDCEEFLRAISA